MEQKKTGASTLKKTFAKVALGLGIALSLAAAIELDGYNAFDSDDGFNLACEIDPACRPLTEGETAMARSVFGDTVDYKTVKIFNRPNLFLSWGARSIGSMHMWNGNIYVLRDDLQAIPDFSLHRSPDDAPNQARIYQSSIIHEIGHVWQYRNDPDFPLHSALSITRNNFDYASLYPFEIDDHKKFSDFNFEQQADIFEHFYYGKNRLYDGTRGMILESPAYFSKEFNRKTQALCKTLDQYTEKIIQVLPQHGYEPKCNMYRPYQEPERNPFADPPPRPPGAH